MADFDNHKAHFVIELNDECTDPDDPNKTPVDLPTPDDPIVGTLSNGDLIEPVWYDEWYVPYKFYTLRAIRVWKNTKTISGFEVIYKPAGLEQGSIGWPP